MEQAVSTIEALGWDPGWAETFAPQAARDRRPARVVAVHRETSIIRDEGGDRAAFVSGAFRFEALAGSDYPTVGDWVALDRDDVIVAVLPRRSVFRRMAADGGRQVASLHDECVRVDQPSPGCDGSTEEAGGSPQ